MFTAGSALVKNNQLSLLLASYGGVCGTYFSSFQDSITRPYAGSRIVRLSALATLYTAISHINSRELPVCSAASTATRCTNAALFSCRQLFVKVAGQLKLNFLGLFDT